MSLHRDDLPPDVIERAEALHPGVKLVCLGDLPTTDPIRAELEAQTREMADRADWSQVFGHCFGCGQMYPAAYPPSATQEFAASGWGQFVVDGWVEESKYFLLCPGCQEPM